MHSFLGCVLFWHVSTDRPAGSFLEWSVRLLSSLHTGQHTFLHVSAKTHLLLTLATWARDTYRKQCEREKGAEGDLQDKFRPGKLLKKHRWKGVKQLLWFLLWVFVSLCRGVSHFAKCVCIFDFRSQDNVLTRLSSDPKTESRAT